MLERLERRFWLCIVVATTPTRDISSRSTDKINMVAVTVIKKLSTYFSTVKRQRNKRFCGLWWLTSEGPTSMAIEHEPEVDWSNIGRR
jgi:hypothetical protein